MDQQIIIRKAVQEDAESLLLHFKKVLTENPNFFATTLEEFTITVAEEVEFIHNLEKNGLLLVAEVAGKIIGMLNFQLSPRKRFSHQGMFGMSIQEAYTNMGIGRSLINQLLDWAKNDPRVEKVSLEVFSNNERAIHVYRKLGFVEEGRRVKAAKLGPNEYVDDLVMSVFV
jgi:RimJ/RimL family protein N-acetyltransferase